MKLFMIVSYYSNTRSSSRCKRSTHFDFDRYK